MIEIVDLTFRYPDGPFRLSIPALNVAQGDRAAVIGASGSGKTTLLHLMAGIIGADAGTIQVGETQVSDLDDAARRDFRITNIGMIFQEFELLEYLTARDNVLLPYRINRSLRLTSDVRDRVKSLAEATGVEKLLDRHPQRLSQGERQRVAICRALITEPKLIFADEPTGNLDPRTSTTIVDVILDQAAARNATVLMVTHDHSLLHRFDRVIDLAELLQVDEMSRVAGAGQ